MAKKNTINKEKCQEYLTYDSKKSVKSAIKAIKGQIQSNNKDIALDIKMKNDEFLSKEKMFLDKINNDLEIKENWNKSLEFYLMELMKKYVEL